MKLVPYERHDAEVKEWDPTVLEVFSVVRDGIVEVLPGHEGEHIGSRTQVHVHVIGAGSEEATAQPGLAAALRNDPDLREEYASLKRAVVAEGTSDPARYSMKKIDWVLATLDRLGLPPLPDPGEPPPPSRRSSPSRSSPYGKS